MKQKLFIGLLILLVGTAAFGVDEGEATPTAIQQKLIELGFRVFKAPVEAPEFELPDLSGQTVSLSSYKGKVVLLNFWATWCPPCRAEMPSMQSLHEMLEDEQFEIVAVDVGETKKTVEKFIEENEYTFPVLLDSSRAVGSIYGARSIPTSYIVDADGNAIGFLVGSRSWDDEEVLSVFRELLDAAE